MIPSTRIENWLRSVVGQGAFDRYEDLHVDDINPQWSDRDKWIDAAVESLNTAAQIRDRLAFQVTVAIGFSLTSSSARSGVPPVPLHDIEPQLDVSPPSLYVFERGHEPWGDDEDFTYWSGIVFGGQQGPPSTYVREWWDEDDDEYRRSLWLAR